MNAALPGSFRSFASGHHGNIGTLDRDFQVVVLDGLGLSLFPGKQPDVCVSFNEHPVSARDEQLLGVQFLEKGDIAFPARRCPVPLDLRQFLFCVDRSRACGECEGNRLTQDKVCVDRPALAAGVWRF